MKKIVSPVFDQRGYQTNISDLNGELLPDLASLRWQHYHGGARRSRVTRVGSPCHSNQTSSLDCFGAWKPRKNNRTLVRTLREEWE